MDRKIPISKDYELTVDEADYKAMMKHKWQTYDSPGQLVSARTTVKVRGKRRRVQAQDILMKPKKGWFVVHLNFKKLDCRRSNLRLVRRTSKLRRTFRQVKGRVGILYSRPAGVFLAIHIDANKTRHQLGPFTTVEEAQAAYTEAAKTNAPWWLREAAFDSRVASSPALQSVAASLKASWDGNFAKLAEMLWRDRIEIEVASDRIPRLSA